MLANYLQDFGPLIDTNTNQETTIQKLSSKFIGLYFTAEWCSACHRLLKTLPSLIQKVNKNNEQNLKLITLRLDQTNSGFAYNYLKFKNIHVSQANWIAETLNVQFLPTLLIFNQNWKLISKNGIQDMQKYGEKTAQYWTVQQ